MAIRDISDTDWELLRQLIAESRRRPPSLRGRPHAEEEQGVAPEVYVARVPASGIPALLNEGAGVGTGTDTYDEPGFTECTIWRVIPNSSGGSELLPTGLSKFVGNISSKPILGNSWVEIIRDKWGQWWAGKEPNCVDTKVVSNVCVRVSTTSGGGTTTGSGDGVATGCCTVKIPSVLTISLTIGLSSYSGTAIYNPLNGRWEYTVTIDGVSYVFQLWCTGGAWYCGSICSGGFGFQFFSASGPTVCNPFSATYTFTSGTCFVSSGSVTFSGASAANSGAGSGAGGTILSISVEKKTFCLPPVTDVTCEDNPGCCAVDGGPGTGTASTNDCTGNGGVGSVCAAWPTKWRVTLSGLSGQLDCPSGLGPVNSCCPSINGTYDLVFDPNNCWWVSDIKTFTCTAFDGLAPFYHGEWQVYLKLTCVGGIFYLTANAAPTAAISCGASATWQLAGSSWKCFGPNDMADSGGGTLSCAGTWPSPVTVVAV